MDQDKFQQLVLDKLEKNDKQFELITEKLEQNDRFQVVVLEHMAKMTQQLVTMDGKMDGLDNRMTKLEILIENNVKPKIDAIFEKLAIHDEEISHLKRLK